MQVFMCSLVIGQRRHGMQHSIGTGIGIMVPRGRFIHQGTIFRGRSRACRRRGHQPLKRGRKPNIFFCEKPHEIKEILVCRAGAPEVPSLRSATDIVVSLDF